MSLILSGATIADVWKQANFRDGWGVIGSGILLRLGVLPVLFLTIVAIGPFDLALDRVIAIQAAMPAAVFPIILAKHYGGDAPTAVRIVLTTHLACLLTCPLWLTIAL
jgi:predicted permease